MMAFASFEDTIHYLYETLPMFQRVGAAALKPDLSNTIAFCNHLGNPQNRFPAIHVAGTNGKGSTSHMLASILATAGYRTGLYTSPHLKSFTERIRVNGREADQQYIVDFVNQHKNFTEFLKPSFFELTVAMAFDYFARAAVDVAVIETGLGGRLDSTNVISPLLSIITNIGNDHRALLGDTPQKIASEKAGIIKKNTPVVISERQPEVQAVFIEKARGLDAPITFASDNFRAAFTDREHGGLEIFKGGKPWLGPVTMPLTGDYQVRNVAGVACAVEILRQIGWKISDDHVSEGLENTVAKTGLKGRWQVLGYKPLIICDTGHNREAVIEVVRQLERVEGRRRLIVWGMVKDKEIDTIMRLLPASAEYFLCAPDLPRALPVAELASAAKSAGLSGHAYASVGDALAAAKSVAEAEDVIFVGGSTFVVAEIPGL